MASPPPIITTETLSEHHHHHHYPRSRDYSQSFGEQGRVDNGTKIGNDRIRFHSTVCTTANDKYLGLIRDILHSPSIHSIRSDSVCSAVDSVSYETSSNHHCYDESSSSKADTNMIQKDYDLNHCTSEACSLSVVDPENTTDNDVQQQQQQQQPSDASTKAIHFENIAEEDGENRKLRGKSSVKSSASRRPVSICYDYFHRISRYVKFHDILVLLALFIVLMIWILILRPVPNDLRSILLFILIWLSSFTLYLLFPTFKRWFYYWNPGFSLYRPC